MTMAFAISSNMAGDPYTVTPATLSTATAGRFELSYKAVNADGFPSIATRVVWIVGVTGDGTINYAKAYEGGRGTSYSNEMGDGTVYLSKTSIPVFFFIISLLTTAPSWYSTRLINSSARPIISIIKYLL